MKTLSAIILALGIIFGTPATVAESPVETASASTVATVSQEEADARVMEMDAMATWSDYLQTPMTSEEISYTWVSYAHEKPQNLPADCITLQSIDFGIWYVYQAHVLTYA